MKRESYTIVLERGPDRRWLVRVPEVPGCHSYGRSIHEARTRIREALDLWVDDADRAELKERIRLPGPIREVVRSGKSARADASRAAQRAQKRLSAAARRLVARGYSLRDAATLLGVSHQRIGQLLEERTGRPTARLLP